MFKILFGIIVGVALTLSALNPSGAKDVAAKSIDAVSQSYQAGAKQLNQMPAIEIPKIPATSDFKALVEEKHPN